MSPEFLRRYYILRIVSTPKVYGIDNGRFVTLSELQKVLDNKRKEFSDNKLYDKLTFHTQKTIKRDIHAIEEYFDIEIKLKRNYGYYIDDFKQTKNLRDIYDKTELFLLNQKSYEWEKHISTESSSLNNSIDINSIVNAIENNLYVHIVFDGWYDDRRFQQYEGYIQPLHIKESNRAWYLVGYNSKLGFFNFALDDRVKELKVTNKLVDNPIVFDEKEYFKDVIGILKIEELQPQRIVLKVTNHHLRYLISKPMHHSQKIISYPKIHESVSIDGNNPDIWATIEIFVQANYEFIMEILKYNRWIKVVSPPNVIDEIVEHLDQMRSFYKP
jgi:predicted DNA-binding transcriptional regulator YafY